MPFAKPPMPTPPDRDRWPGSLIRAASTALPNTSISAAQRPAHRRYSRAAGQQPKSSEASPPFGQSLFGEHPHLRFELLDAARQLIDQLTFRIGQISVFEIVARVDTRANHSSRHAHYGRVIRNRANHHRSRADLGVMSNRDIAENLRPRPDHDIVADGGMALAFFLAGSAQRHALIHEHVVANFRRFSDHHAHAVIDEASPADGRARMDLNAGQGPVDLRQNPRQLREPRLMHPVGGTMQQDRVEAGVTEEDFDRALGRWITAEN